MEIHTSIIIDAPAFGVWNVLTDLASYHSWNPFIRRIRGELVRGSRLEMEIRLADEKMVQLDPVVANVELERQIAWQGRISSLFSTEHKMAIEPLTHDRVTFYQVEKFAGPIVSLVAHKLDAALHKGFEEMNQALKSVAERNWNNKQ